MLLFFFSFHKVPTPTPTTIKKNHGNTPHLSARSPETENNEVTFNHFVQKIGSLNTNDDDDDIFYYSPKGNLLQVSKIHFHILKYTHTHTHKTRHKKKTIILEKTIIWYCVQPRERESNLFPKI